MGKLWNYGTSTPIQRVGVIILGIGLLSLITWIIKEDLSFDDLFDPYYLPDSRDSFFFHLFLYLIPIGLSMSWGYQILVRIKEWIINDRPEKLKSEQKKFYTPPKKNLHFKNNLAAFQFAAQQYSANMSPKKVSLGIIQDIYKFEDGSIQFFIQLADVGKTTLVSGINDKHSEKLSKGNLIYWGYIDQVDEPNSLHVVAIGHILASLYPEYDPNNGKWVIRHDLTQ